MTDDIIREDVEVKFKLKDGSIIFLPGTKLIRNIDKK